MNETPKLKAQLLVTEQDLRSAHARLALVEEENIRLRRNMAVQTEELNRVSEVGLNYLLERNCWISIAKSFARKRVWSLQYNRDLGEALVKSNHERVELQDVVNALTPNTPA